MTLMCTQSIKNSNCSRMSLKGKGEQKKRRGLKKKKAKNERRRKETTKIKRKKRKRRKQINQRLAKRVNPNPNKKSIKFESYKGIWLLVDF